MGETAACRFLTDKGMEVLDRRYRASRGELDLVMLDGDVLVIAEVKVRERMSSAMAQFALTGNKQRRVIDAARGYLGEHPEHSHRMVRFDAVIIGCDGIEHIPNAFEGAAW